MKTKLLVSAAALALVAGSAQAQDLTFVKDEVRAEVGNDSMQKQVDDYLANLRKSAKIIYN